MSKIPAWLSTIRFPERIILITLLIIGGGVWGFIAVADEMVEGDTKRFDEWALSALRDPQDLSAPIGPLWLRDVARDITALGSGSVILLITGAVLGMLLLERKWHLMLLVSVSVMGGALLTTLLKESFARERPSLVPHLTRVTSASFPSGHSMISAVVYITLGALLARSTKDTLTKYYYIFVAVMLAFIIGLSRVYLGVHYPTDVLAGWCAGAAWALACAMVARWLQQRGKVEQGSAPPVEEKTESKRA